METPFKRRFYLKEIFCSKMSPTKKGGRNENGRGVPTDSLPVHFEFGEFTLR